jgi:hypothetical protein
VTARDDDDDDEGQMGQTTINSSPTTHRLEIKWCRLSYKLHRDTIDDIPVSRLSPVVSGVDLSSVRSHYTKIRL